jgi:hypothetical protein
MCAQSVDRHWFISRQGKRYGPYSFEALTEAVAKGVIDANTSVWRLGWVQWHPAKRVPGLIAEPPPEPEAPEIEDPIDEQEAPRDLDPEDVPPLVDEPPQAPGRSADAARAVLRPLRQPDARRVPGRADTGSSMTPPQATLDDAEEQPPGDGASRRVAPRLVTEAPSAERPPRKINGGVPEAPPQQRGEAGRAPEIPPQQREEVAGAPELPLQQRDDFPRGKPPARRRGAIFKRAAGGVVVLLLVIGAGWGLFRSGLIPVVASRLSARTAEINARQVPEPTSPAKVAGLPDIVATLPAVEALAVNDPAAFDRFVKRFAAMAANAREDELLSLARIALRRSVRRALANSSGDTLLEITDTYLDYMKALVAANPESCVALSDESKGAKLSVNFAKDYPILFIRDMAVMDRIASTGPKAVVTPPTAEQVQPILESLFKVLRSQPVQADLLRREKLTPAEYEPYCQLVIAFYDAVLAMPRDDKINLLRYLYAGAAVDADDDAPK